MRQRCIGACCWWTAGVWVMLLAGCALDPPTLPQASVPLGDTPVAEASVPSPSSATLPFAPASAPPSLAAAPTATTPAAPTKTVTPTPDQTPTAVHASSSPRARADDGYCRRTFGGSSAARFSARLIDVEMIALADRTDVVLQFADTQGPLHGVAACRWAGTWPQTNDLGAQAAPGPAFIALDLADWAHDDAFAASIMTGTLEMKALTPAAPPSPQLGGGDGGGGLTIAISANSLDSRGALLGIGLEEPRPFTVRVEDERVIVSIANDDVAPFPPANDPLGTAQGTSQEDQALLLVQDDALFRVDARGTQPVSTTLRAITGLALNDAETQLAVCAADPNDADQQALWVLDAGGTNERVLANVGGCAEPAWSPDGSMIAFVAAETGTTLPSVWTVDAAGGEVAPIRASFDQWSRSAPRWLRNDRLVYRATDETGASVLLINENNVERELSARLLTGTAYRGVGAFVVDLDQDLIAVQALRAADDGADLVLLRADGSVLATEQRGWTHQPLGFTNDGLLYLSIECPSDTVQPYALRRRSASGAIETLLSGDTAHTIGAAVVHDDALLYVRAPAVEAAGQPSEVWLLANDGTARAQAYASPKLIKHVVPAPPVP